MLIDSNIFIYAIKPEFQSIRNWIFNNDISVSDITLIEVLGYHRLMQEDKTDFIKLFNCAQKIPLSSQIVKLAIYLRQQRKISLGDSFIAATAIQNNKTLVTRNIKDFEWIDDLKRFNPVEEENS